ncbi:MAG: GNAT family N-acetyltransferase [Anaerolineae bacterium]|nr:GNAT family N-acetyltransferase [Anaerolineae bacterium]
MTQQYRIVHIKQSNDSLLQEVFTMRNELMNYHGRVPPPEPFMRIVPQRVHEETTRLSVILDRDTAAGYTMAFDVAEHPFMPDWQRAGYITHFYIREAYRKQGLGQLLYNDVITWFRQRQVAKIMLNVAIENMLGQRFWEKQGFEPIAIRMKLTLY